jgi:hypothetical protein
MQRRPFGAASVLLAEGRSQTSKLVEATFVRLLRTVW